MITRTENSLTLSPLEQFMRDYVDAREGAWEEIEPQVYDLLIDSEMMEVAFDPEALPEHPQARLASLGSPLFDRLLGDAAQRWNSAYLFRNGLNVRPHGLESRVMRAISLSPHASITVERARVMNFPQALFWFKATFTGDQKEEEILPVGIDLHYQREVRHLEALLSRERLSEHPEMNLPEAPHAATATGYRIARDRAARSAGALANARRREWAGRVEKQIARMSDYYAQLRREADERAARADDPASLASRIDAIEREKQIRIAELRQKSAVQLHIKLSSLMIVHQPKLFISAGLAFKNQSAGALHLVWDPLTESIEPAPCPICSQPTFAFNVDRRGVRCSTCRPARLST